MDPTAPTITFVIQVSKDSDFLLGTNLFPSLSTSFIYLAIDRFILYTLLTLCPLKLHLYLDQTNLYKSQINKMITTQLVNLDIVVMDLL